MTADAGLGPGPWGVYLHVPWCTRRCPYCSFYVEVDRGPDHADFVRSCTIELDLQRPQFAELGPPHTVSFGGGTPSRLPAEHLKALLDHIQPRADAEISLEANPEDLDPATLHRLLTAGVNRLSIGLQTFQAQHARLLNRASTVQQASQSLRDVAAAGFSSWSVDLIFGLPGQTLDDLNADLDAIEAAQPPHVSLYGLTFEPGTPFDRARQKGALTPLDDDTWRDLADRIDERLGQMGLHRYEVSNFAKPGHESRHNELYWTDRPYLGIGPSAHSYGPAGHRWQAPADLAQWKGAAGTVQRDQPTHEQAATDLLISTLRGRQGVPLARLQRRTGLTVSNTVIAPLLGAALIESDGHYLSLTARGIAVTDGVIEQLVRGLQPAE
ncbi:MAG: radical SAM family heme chaperone HemW [Myxococcota bacterium]